MNSDRIKSKAQLFNVVANVVIELDSAWDKGLAWQSSVAMTHGPDGKPDGGREIRIQIHPPGVAQPSLDELLAEPPTKKALAVAGAS